MTRVCVSEILSSDDFELVENSDDEENAENSAKEAGREGQEDVASMEKKSDEEQKDEKDGIDGNAVKSEDAAKMSGSSNDEKDVLKSEKTETSNDKDLGFHIKSYEEILREKALRKMLERRQQLQAPPEGEGSPADHMKLNATENRLESTEKEEGLKAAFLII